MLRKIDIARSWALAKAEHAALTAERDSLRYELQRIKAERDEFRALLAELRAAVTARWQAEQRLFGRLQDFELFGWKVLLDCILHDGAQLVRINCIKLDRNRAAEALRPRV